MPIVKPPDMAPPWVTQALDATRVADEGLENMQEVSIGRKPLPLTEIAEPTRPVPALRRMTGDDSMLRKTRLPRAIRIMMVKRRAKADRKGGSELYGVVGQKYHL